jgi:hypothetical protein
MGAGQTKVGEMSDTDLIRKCGGDTYYRETPDGKVLREALIYAMYSNPLQGYIGPSERLETKSFGANRTGWGPDSDLRKVQRIEGLPFWRYEIFEVNEEAMAPMLTDFEITDDRFDWMTDIFCWTPMSIVRQKVRDFLLDTDPEGHMFFPTKIFGESSGLELQGSFFSLVAEETSFSFT